MRLPIFVSLRWKITALVGLVVLMITAFDAYYGGARAADAERVALQERSLSLAAAIAALGTQNVQASAIEGLRPALVDPRVIWAAAYDAKGEHLGRVGRHGRGDGAPRRLDEGPAEASVLTLSDAQIVVAAPMPGTADAGAARSGGSIVLAMDGSSVAARRSEARVAILLQALIIGLIGLALAWLVATPMTRAIEKMRDNVAHIARGDLSGGVASIHTADDLGKMASSLGTMTQSLGELQEGLRKVAEGDLHVDAHGDGELFQAFGRMVASLREMAERINRGSAQLASSAAGMFSAVREQETIATQQTSSLEEIRRTLDALNRAAEGVATDADAVRDMAERALASSQRMAEQTRMVSTHSDAIGEILSLIQDIADRSDLLAFNAALEGTKAGEVGKGFSLVAAEMRRLSEHVMDSVRDIRKLVADMRASSHASVLATEESTKLAREAATAAGKISQSMTFQMEGTSQVKSAADEIVRAVNDALAGAAASTESAETLLELSHELRQAAEAFRLSPGETE